MNPTILIYKYICVRANPPVNSSEFFGRNISAFKEPKCWHCHHSRDELGKPADAGGQVVPTRHLARRRAARQGECASDRRWKNRNYNRHKGEKIALILGACNQMSAKISLGIAWKEIWIIYPLAICFVEHERIKTVASHASFPRMQHILRHWCKHRDKATASVSTVWRRWRCGCKSHRWDTSSSGADLAAQETVSWLCPAVALICSGFFCKTNLQKIKKFYSTLVLPSLPSAVGSETSIFPSFCASFFFPLLLQTLWYYSTVKY